jgi:nucleotide-binding universal stress UspA family protein
MEVIVFVDPAPRGEWALTVAAQLCGGWARAVRLLATEADVAGDPGLLERARGRLEGLASITESVRPGPAEKALVEEARQQPGDLVVVPPAGRGALARMLKGSRVATVVRRVRAPVLVARRPPDRIERLLVALSGGASTTNVLEMALGWERHLGGRPVFLHVRPEVSLPRAPTVPDSAGSEAVDAVRRALGARQDELQLPEGLVVEEVLAELDNGAHHLLVVGARRDEDAGFGREDVTERLLLHCPASMLVVP